MWFFSVFNLFLFFTVVHRYVRHCYTSGKDGLWRISSTVNINTICCFMYFPYLSLNQEFSAAFWRRTGLGLRMCVLFECGRNRDFQGLSLIFLICIEVQFGNNDTSMINVSLLLFCFFFLPLRRGDRYDALRACIGDPLCQKLHNLNVFLVSMPETVRLFANTLLVQLMSLVSKIKKIIN